MNKLQNFIGIDISKQTIDVAVIVNSNKDNIVHRCFKKDKGSLVQLVKWLQSLDVAFDESTVCCMEHTGLYNRNLLEFLHKYEMIIWVEMAQHIQRSLGLQRGKTDRVDAHRIALFAFKNRDEAKACKPVLADIQELKDLVAQRERLLQCKVKLNVPIKELSQQGCIKEARILQQLQKATTDAIEKSIAKVEAAIRAIINKSEPLKNKVSRITSVPGIGEVIAWNFIVHTNGFERLQSGKQLACYCGVVPFKHQSGTSIKGRTRVSHMANKKLKMLLHMGAMAAISHNEELSVYYKRKVLEGKNKMSILNAIRNKLVLRIAAVVREDKAYIKLETAA